jgi:hypothetical protein
MQTTLPLLNVKLNSEVCCGIDAYRIFDILWGYNASLLHLGALASNTIIRSSPDVDELLRTFGSEKVPC